MPPRLSLSRPRHAGWWAGAAAAAIVAASLATGVVGHATVTSPSMAPTHATGSSVLTTRIGVGSVGPGDVVVFDVPPSWRAAERERAGQAADAGGGDAMVKRLIGLPGDRITCCAPGGLLMRNGSLLEEPYLAEPPGDLLNTTYDVTVPAGHAWVLGDNRRRSFDSRAMHARTGASGFLPLSAIRARVLFGWP
ncbi:signal peptidase I [Aeromicrobium duanguangcaii]|uniref:signal peptidase I n=1 Tax=Aeromicrobium duanguangcaii TaxID=2968086 RepID=UPI0020178B48|nr:signal peptidase I [Aeromicrobium duanguangcaii]